jgi:3-hydroxybutyryl-CoA dehydratase
MTGQLVTTTLKVDMESVRAYADLTDDYNPIHLDPAFAAATPMGGVIAHGTMSVCLLWQAIFRNFSPDMLSSAELDVRFVKPVRLGERLEAGGQRDAGDPQLYAVWVRADDGAERLAGTLRMSAIPAQGRAPS